MLQTCETPGLLPVDTAIAKMLEQTTALKNIESIEIDEALSRVIQADVIASINVPPADNSAMDGYALNCADLAEHQTLTLVGTALAGQPYKKQLEKGQCVRIMTGGTIPKGANAVVMQENTSKDGDIVTFLQMPTAGENIRLAGEDIQLGQQVVTAGTKLTAAHLALIASVGIAEVTVATKLKIGLIATGDELTTPGKPLKPGAIYESNRVALKALLAAHPVEVIDFGIVADDKKQLIEVFTQAGTLCDLVISCGGVSVGDADYVKEVLNQLGSIDFWKVAIKPGKPFAFGQLQHALFCGLPGNPVSSYVTFEQLVVPLIQQLTGQQLSQPLPFVAQAACLIKKRPGRADYQRGIFYRAPDGKLLVKPNGKQGSGIMSSITNANCYILLEQDSNDIQAGDTVKIQPF